MKEPKRVNPIDQGMKDMFTSKTFRVYVYVALAMFLCICLSLCAVPLAWRLLSRTL